MTQNATKLITPLTFQSITKNNVLVDTMQEKDSSQIAHIASIQNADLLVIAPATANIIGKIAHGIADDMLSTMCLAAKPLLPKLFAPAMNTQMYQNQIVQNNISILKENGFKEIQPKNSYLACGDKGVGALANIDEIQKIILESL